MTSRRWVLFALIAFFCGHGSALAQLLYDGSAGSTPEAQGWLNFQSLGGSATHTTGGGKTTLDTTLLPAIQAGWSNYNLITPVNSSFPPLNRAQGYIVALDMKLLSESHVSNDRAGVSLIVLSQDLRGIEIAFWTNEVWVQSGPDFHHAEGAAFDTTAASRSYHLAILGNDYALRADGQLLFTGQLRDYSSFGLPYNLPNFIFLGDDTTSASGSMEFSRLGVVVPEPAMAGLILVAGLSLARRRC